MNYWFVLTLYFTFDNFHVAHDKLWYENHRNRFTVSNKVQYSRYSNQSKNHQFKKKKYRIQHCLKEKRVNSRRGQFCRNERQRLIKVGTQNGGKSPVKWRRMRQRNSTSKMKFSGGFESTERRFNLLSLLFRRVQVSGLKISRILSMLDEDTRAVAGTRRGFGTSYGIAFLKASRVTT